MGGWLAYANLRARADAENPGPQSFGRFLVYPAIVATPAIIGLVLWMLSLPISGVIDSPQPQAGAVLGDVLLFDTGLAFALVVVFTLIAQAWIARARMAQFVGADFGRVEPLIVVPETATILALVLVFLVFGRIQSFLGAGVDPSAIRLNLLTSTLGTLGIGSLALLLGAVLSNQVEDLRGRGFLRALLRAEVGVVVVLWLFVAAYLQVSNL
jgi:hypothetical protein